MTEIPPGFSFVEDDDGFVLRSKNADGAVIAIRMSAEDLFAFKASIALWTDRRMSELQVGPGPVQPIVAHEIAQIRLRPDAVQEHVLLTVRGPSSGEMTLSFPLPVADCIAAELPSLLAEMRVAKPTKQ